MAGSASSRDQAAPLATAEQREYSASTQNMKRFYFEIRAIFVKSRWNSWRAEYPGLANWLT